MTSVFEKTAALSPYFVRFRRDKEGTGRHFLEKTAGDCAFFRCDLPLFAKNYEKYVKVFDFFAIMFYFKENPQR